MEYDRLPRSPATMRETLSPYLGASEPGPYAKLSISVPSALLDVVRSVAEETGTSVSGVVAATLRRLVDEVEQARLDAALDADRAENLEFARAAAPSDAALLRDLKW